MVGGMGGGMVHGGALEGTGALMGGKTMPDLGQRAGSKPQSNEKVFVRSRAEEGVCCCSVLGCCCCFEVWFGWRWLVVVLLDGVSSEASRLGTITVERGTGERSQRAAYAWAGVRLQGGFEEVRNPATQVKIIQADQIIQRLLLLIQKYGC